MTCFGVLLRGYKREVDRRGEGGAGTSRVEKILRRVTQVGHHLVVGPVSGLGLVNVDWTVHKGYDAGPRAPPAPPRLSPPPPPLPPTLPPPPPRGGALPLCGKSGALRGTVVRGRVEVQTRNRSAKSIASKRDTEGYV